MSPAGSELRIAVIGAGIVGVSAAEWLRRDGHAVTLFDRQEPGEGASFGNGGVLAACAVVPVPVPGVLAKAPGMWLRRDGPLFLRLGYLPKLAPWLVPYLKNARTDRVRQISSALGYLLTDTVEQHQALARGTPAERWLETSDYLYLYRTRADFKADRFGWALRAAQGIAGDELDRSQLLEIDASISDRYQFACRMDNHGYITDPGRYVKDLAAWFQGQGGEFMRSEVRDVVARPDGARIVHAGGELEVDRVVLATGAWSQRLAGRLGHQVRLEAERGYHVEYSQPSNMPNCPYMIADAKMVVTPMDGRVRAAGLVEFGGLDAPASPAPGRMIDRAMAKLYPGLKYENRSEWLGFRPSTVDSLPLLGPSPSHESVCFAFGHQHIGLTSGPKSGRVIADLIAGRKTNADLRPFAINRFD